MGWLNKIFSNAKRPKNANMNMQVSMRGYEPTFTSFGSNILYSDVIYSALKMKARFFGKLDPRHIRIRDDKIELVTDSSVARLMRTPNDFQTIYDFLTQAYFMREKDDNCFIYPDYYISNARQRIYTGLYILLPVMTPIVEQDESGNLFLRFQFVNPSREVVFPYEDIIVWRQNIEDNQFIGGGKYAGLANADLLNSLSAYHTAKEAVAEAAKLGCHFDGILKVNAFGSDQEKIKEIRNAFIDDLKKNKSGIAVLDNGAEYQDIQRSLKMVDAATLQEIKNNVFLHTGVTMDMLQGKFTAADKESFYENWIEPAAISLGQAMSKVFFSQWQTSYGDQVQLYPRKIQLMSTSEITQVVQTTINAGVFTLDEYREMYGYAPLPNGEGQQRPRGFNNLDGEIGGDAPDKNPAPIGESAEQEQKKRYNENHDSDNGQFADSDSGGSGSDKVIKVPSVKIDGPKQTRAFIDKYVEEHPEIKGEIEKYQNVLDNVKNFEKTHPNAENGTYNAITGELVPDDQMPPFAVTFHQNLSLKDPYGAYTSEDYAAMCAISIKELGAKDVYIGYFGNPEVSFSCASFETAMHFAIEHNQQSIYDSTGKYTRTGEPDTVTNDYYNPKTNPTR